MTERPILFNGAMVRAILDGRKTHTRRPVDLDNLRGMLHRQVHGDSIFSHIVAGPGKCKLRANSNFAISVDLGKELLGLRPGEFNFVSPFAGECTAKTDNRRWTLTPIEPCRLWVRETWQTLQMWDHLPPNKVPTDPDIQYPATWEHWVSKRRPSIHMPRWASRITLEIVGVRVERLQDITEDGAIAEGIENCDGITGAYLDYLETSAEQLVGTSALNSFRSLWDSIYQDSQAWDANPWVWDIEFRVAERRDK